MATMPRPPLPPPPGPGGAPGPMGGPPGPMGGPMMQQAVGALAGAVPGGDPAAALQSLQQLAGPDNVEVAIKRAQDTLGQAMSWVHQRSPEVAKELASALMNCKQALQKLQTLPREEVPAPPRGLPMSPQMFGGPPPPMMGGPANTD